MNALPINVYRTNFEDGSNGGITSRYDVLLLICDEGCFGSMTIDEENPPENLVKIVTRVLSGREYKHIEPYAPVKSGYIGYMYGGALGYIPEYTFTDISEYPLCIFDRQETQEEQMKYFD